MTKPNWTFAVLLLSVSPMAAPAQTQPIKVRAERLSGTAPLNHNPQNAATLDPVREKLALQIFLKSVQTQIVSAADAMPAVKYNFAPIEGEFKGVRTFGQQVKHLAATNHILAAAALGEDPPPDAGDEQGPESVRTKAEILDYLNSSLAHLSRAIEAVGGPGVARSSPISPLPPARTTRLALCVEALIHAFDHYGQMVEYLRMNGVVPPGSRP